MARADAPVRIDHPLPHPRVGRARVRAGERLEERQPLEVAPLLLARRALAAPRIDRLRDLVLFADRARRSRPAVVEHARPGGPRTNLPVLGADAKPLRSLIGPDVATQPDAAHLATIPAPVGGDPIEAAVKVEIVDEQSFHSIVRIPFHTHLESPTRHALLTAY